MRFFRSLETPRRSWALGLSLALLGCTGSSDQAADEATSIPDSHLPAAEAKVPVELGPVLGAVTENTASVWVQTAGPASLQLEYQASNSIEPALKTPAALPTEASDWSATLTLSGLTPGTCYRYRVLSDGVASTAAKEFCTFPRNAETIVVGLLADLDKRPWYPAPSIDVLAAEDPDLLMILGDWDHRDPTSEAELRAMHRENRSPGKHAGNLMVRHFLGSVPVAYIWDDHDFGENNSNRFSPLRDAALAVYDDYWPGYREPGSGGVWQKFSYADIAEFFLLDVRSQRDLQTYLDPRFRPDDSPDGNRGILRNDPDRSMLDGAALPEGSPGGQKEWLFRSLLASRLPWKVIVSPVTWNITTVKDDAWWDYLAERNEILSFIEQNTITGVIFVSADIHSGGAIDDGTHAGLPEISIPSTNLNETSNGRPTCAIHRSPERTIATSCGEWSAGFSRHGSGFGLLRLSRSTATLETRNMLGESRSLTLGLDPL